VAETTTDRSGHYRFSSLELGSYTVKAVDRTGWVQTTRAPATISITRGITISGVDFGFARTSV
jgi:hypothetical protein